MRNVISLVLGGGKGTRLYPLTKHRSKPAVPLAAKYRLIDIPISNCLNCGLNRVYVLTQFNSVSLHRHISNSYKFDQFSGGFVEILAAQQTNDSLNWFQGTADAVRQNIQYLQEPGIEYVLILSGDQLYRMNYLDMLKTHKESGADVTLAALPMDAEAASSFGIVRVNDEGRVQGFLEKPKTRAELDLVRTDPAWIDAHGLQSRGRECLASMGIYIFNRQVLIDALTKTNYADFGKEIFPAAIRSHHVQAHLFDGYWEDIGTIKAFFDANLLLASPNPPFELASSTERIYTRLRFLPPTQCDGATIRHSLLADGCHIGEGSVIENSVIGVRCRIGKNVTIRNSILMGNDEFQTAAEIAGDLAAKRAPQGVGDGSIIEGAIIDKNCRIGRNARVTNPDALEESPEKAGVMIRDGIVCVMKEAELPDGWQTSTR